LVAGVKKYVEWMSRGRKTDRVAYVLTEWDLPEPRAGAEWAADNTFDAAAELLRDPALKDACERFQRRPSRVHPLAER
jgi:hypothetical protein